MAAPFPSGVPQYVQIFLPLTDLFRWCGGSGELVGDGEEAEEDLDCWDQLDEGVPAPPPRELME